MFFDRLCTGERIITFKFENLSNLHKIKSNIKILLDRRAWRSWLEPTGILKVPMRRGESSSSVYAAVTPLKTSMGGYPILFFIIFKITNDIHIYSYRQF